MNFEGRFIIYMPEDEMTSFCLVDQHSEKKWNNSSTEKKSTEKKSTEEKAPEESETESEESETESEEALLKLNGYQIDKYMTKKMPNATNLELHRLKGIRRKVKNREYAKRSRDEAKHRVADLVKVCDSLTEENRDLKQRIFELENSRERWSIKDLIYF